LPSFFAEQAGGRVTITGADARHLARSLRARLGEEIDVIDPTGHLLTVRLDVVSPDRVEGVVVSERPHQSEPTAKITIAIANLPAPALELVLSRCTEAGAHAFHVFQAERSVARGAKLDRWSTICREAAMLAGRLLIPAVDALSSLEDVLEASDHAVMLARDAPQALAKLTAPRDLTLLVGPEGGWSERELDAVPLKAGLGPRNLRADTAALVGLSVALAVRE
jgi:16S rRNA (uracil1498-N3)-methyltransferase